jgi:hypothetical protein
MDNTTHTVLLTLRKTESREFKNLRDNQVMIAQLYFFHGAFLQDAPSSCEPFLCLPLVKSTAINYILTV